MALTDEEKSKIRKHLGYPEVDVASGIGLGMPLLYQALFPVDGALRRLKPIAEPQVRDILAKCDAAEQAIAEAETRLAASAVGDIRLRDNEIQARKAQYRYWCRRLSEVTGAPLNPYSERVSGDGIVMRAVK
jgi:hypothetical protein